MRPSGGAPSHERMGRVRALVALGRPRTCTVCALAFVFGAAEGGTLGLSAVVGAVIALLVPFIGNVHNAGADLDEDAANLPGRAALLDALGAAPLRRAVRVSVVVIVAVCALLGLWSALVGLGYAAGLLQYSAPPVRAKRRPIIGLFVFSQVVALPYVHGVVTAGADEGWARFDVSRPVALLVTQWVFLTTWFTAKGMVKNIPDRAGDLAAGVQTSATLASSPRAAARAALVATGAAYLVAPVALAWGRDPAWPLALLVLWAPIAIANVARMLPADGAAANGVLKTDMAVSVGFLVSVCLVTHPTAGVVALVVGLVLLIPAADLADLDSRRARDLPHGTPAV